MNISQFFLLTTDIKSCLSLCRFLDSGKKESVCPVDQEMASSFANRGAKIFQVLVLKTEAPVFGWLRVLQLRA